MNLPSLLLSTLFTMECLCWSIPSISENKSWIRRVKREEGDSNSECPDCLALSDEGHGDRDGHPKHQPRKNHTKCPLEQEERRRAVTSASEFIPSCRKDGSYSLVQCHPATRSCWCAERVSGRPISGTTILYKKPNCAKYSGRRSKSVTKRRSSQGKKNRNSCNHADRATFNTALLKVFRSELNRLRATSQAREEFDSKIDDDVLLWKFSYLDRNKDNFLRRNETIFLKQLVKQQIQPRQCAKSFISFCAKGDKKITKKEWLECLRIEAVESLPFDTFNSLVDSVSSRGLNPFQHLRPVGSMSSGGTELITTLQSNTPVQEPTNNCTIERQSALTSQRSDSNKSIIIPECTVTGHYQRTQCAQGKAYCWCVNETTGQEIPHTVSVNSMPNCDKPVRGCMNRKKEKFLIDLMDTLTKSMLAGFNRGERRLPGEFRNQTVEEQAARWHFDRLDINKNLFLDRKEWKIFKNETSTDKRLRRCGKKLPRLCDVNRDNKITVTEWLTCLQAKSDTHTTKRTPPRANGPRSGKNPFTTILQK